MGLKCTRCGRFVEPTDEAIALGVCGYCSGEYVQADIRECFDGSPCTKDDQDYNTCKYLIGGGERNV